MPRSELLSEAQEPERYHDWIEKRRRRLPIRGKKRADLECEELGTLNAPRPGRSKTVRLSTVVAQARAMYRLEQKLGLFEGQETTVIGALLAAGLYVDYAAIVGRILSLTTITDGKVHVVASEHAALTGDDGVGALPDPAKFLKRWDQLSLPFFSDTIPFLDAAADGWMKSRTWDNVPYPFVPAIACFHVRQNFHGLKLLRDHRNSLAQLWIATRFNGKASTSAEAASSSDSDTAELTPEAKEERRQQYAQLLYALTIASSVVS